MAVLEALDMQLDSVRTVLKNEVNEITVCVDLRRKTGVFYTMISIASPPVRKSVAALMATQNVFAGNRDFIGSFTQRDSLNLVFLYRNEATLSRHEALYVKDFASRKQIGEKLLVALAETELAGSIGLLLLSEQNINIAPDSSIYFNYFLDFAAWDPQNGEKEFFRKCSQMVFGIISKEYEVRYGNVIQYPIELQAFHKKTQNRGFTSYNSILSFLKMIPDRPSEPNVGIRKVTGGVKNLAQWVRANATVLFVCLLLLVTVAYTGYQIVQRLSYRSAVSENTTYMGLESIGEVYLGDEAV